MSAVGRYDIDLCSSSSPPLRLDFEDAKAFQLELLTLLEKYGKKRGSQSYLSYLALAPRGISLEEA